MNNNSKRCATNIVKKRMLPIVIAGATFMSSIGLGGCVALEENLVEIEPDIIFDNVLE